MLSQKHKDALKKNWGEKADTQNCFAEVKLIDPLSSWKCYIFAMDQNEEMVQCLLHSDPWGLEISTLCISDIHQMYNEEGENPVIDKEYRRTRVNELVRRLRDDT